MGIREVFRILRTIDRRWRNPQENPMTVWRMTLFYIQTKIYLQSHRLPAIQLPFTSTQNDASFKPRIAVIVHCFYPDLMEELLAYIQQIPFDYQLYVSTDTGEKRGEIIHQIDKHQIHAAEVRLTPNRGRDISAKFITFRDVYARCDYFLHLHSKKSPHTGSWGTAWRQQLLQTLAGSPEIVRSNLRLLADPRLGLVFPIPMYDKLPPLRWGDNFAASSELAWRMGIQIRPEFCADYPSGSMFWGKALVIKPLLELGLKLEDFPAEKGQMDGCLQHAIERMIIYSTLKLGLSGCRVSTNPAYPNLQHAMSEATVTSAISACLDAQEQERLRYERPARKS